VNANVGIFYEDKDKGGLQNYVFEAALVAFGHEMKGKDQCAR
jgi:hypothetical protein